MTTEANTDLPFQSGMRTVANVIDHLVDAVGDPSISIRRALILVDIDDHPDTTQAEMITRLDLDKSTLSRNIDWLENYGCIARTYGYNDARVFHLRTSSFSSNRIDRALNEMKGNHDNLKKLLISLIDMFEDRVPTLRDAKILATIGASDTVGRQELQQNLYNSPASTQRRSIQTLVDEGMIKDNGA